MPRSQHWWVRPVRCLVIATVAVRGVMHPIAAAGASAVAPNAATPNTAKANAATSPYRSPVAGALVVINAFDALANPYAAGHRGVDLALADGSEVFAAAAGVVRYAGLVAGRGLVVLEHSDGILTEYEPLSAAVHVGQTVARGQPLGMLLGAHTGCAHKCVHWGARRNGAYFDPLSLLRPLGIVRLLSCSCLPAD